VRDDGPDYREEYMRLGSRDRRGTIRLRSFAPPDRRGRLSPRELCSNQPQLGEVLAVARWVESHEAVGAKLGMSGDDKIHQQAFG